MFFKLTPHSFYRLLIFLFSASVALNCFSSACCAENNTVKLSDSLKKSLSILNPAALKEIEGQLNRLAPDKRKLAEKGVDKLFGSSFEKVFNKNLNPSDIFSVAESIAAASDGDWNTAVEKGSVLMQAAPYFSNFNAYLTLVSGTKELIKTSIQVWEKDLYNTDAYFNAQKIFTRELNNRIDPYIPSYLIKFDSKSVAAEDLQAIKESMMKKEEGMFTEWQFKDSSHEHAVDVLVTGPWASRLRSILKKDPTVKQIFNHFLYYYTSGPGLRPEITETYRYHYLLPMSKKISRMYRDQWAAMIKSGFAREIKRAAESSKPRLKVRPVMEKNITGVTFQLTGVPADTDFTYAVTPKADGSPWAPVSGMIHSDGSGNAAGGYKMPNMNLKNVSVMYLDVKISGPEGRIASGGWTFKTGGLEVKDPNFEKYSEEYEKALSTANERMQKLMTKLGTDYSKLDSKIKSLNNEAQGLVDKNRALSARADSLSNEGKDEQAFNDTVRNHDKNSKRIEEINSSLRKLYRERDSIRGLGKIFGNRRFKPDELVDVFKKVISHPLTQKHGMKAEFSDSLKNISTALTGMRKAS